MGKILLIAEKDSLGQQIAKALKVSKKIQDGGAYYYESDSIIIAMASGHLLQRIPVVKSSELPYLPAQYALEPIKTKYKKLALIKKLANRSDVIEVCNACDPGREGELICHLIYEFTDCRKSYTRMWANTQTPLGIQKEFAGRKPSSDYVNLLNSALARHDADFKLGINATRCLQHLMQKTVGNNLLFSAGRVRTPTMAKIYDLEQQILNFKPTTYYELEVLLQDRAQQKLTAKWVHPDQLMQKEIWPDESDVPLEAEEAADDLRFKLLQVDTAEAIKIKCRRPPISITVDSNDTEIDQSPPGLFDITDLIEAANAEFKWSVKEVNDNLQQLYENGLVTYPRSESKFLGSDAVEATQATFAYLAEQGYMGAAVVLESGWVNAKNSVFDTQKLIDGHGGIVPEVPGDNVNILSFSTDAQKLYRLIAARFIAKFYPPAKFHVINYLFVINGEYFKATARACIDLGWRVLKGVDDLPVDDGMALDLHSLSLLNVEVQIKQTSPPKRLTLGKIPKMMKRYHLGTAATRGSIVSELLATGDARRVQYLVAQNNTVLPTVENGRVVEFLRQHDIDDLTQHELTAKLEQELEQIARGKLTVNQFAATVDAEVMRIVRQFQNYLDSVPEYKREVGCCPKCSAVLFDKGHRFIECSCGFKLWKTVWGINLTSEHIKSLLHAPYETEIIKGFYSTKAKKKFDTALGLNSAEDWKLVPIFVKNKQAQTERQETRYCCPHCQSKLFLNVTNETNKQLVCLSTTHEFALRLFVAQRKLSGVEVQELLVNKYLSSRKGYISKKGKEFATALVMADDGSLSFEFDN